MSNVTLGPIHNAYVPGVSPAPADGGGISGGIGAPAGSGSFSDVLSSAVHTVNNLHDTAASQVTNLLQGGGGDLNGVMVAVEKADVAFQLMMQVRNKIVNAYQEIERMQF